MMALAVLGIVGLHGSGKTEVAKAMGKFDIPSIRMGDVVLEELERRGREINEANVAIIADELRRREGLGAIAKRCIPLIRARGEGKRAVVVDGIRGIAEVEEFRRVFGGDFYLIAVWANERIRYGRVESRRRIDDVRSLETFRGKDRRELGWGLGEAFALADFMILNEGTLEELHQRAIEIFKSLTGG